MATSPVFAGTAEESGTRTKVCEKTLGWPSTFFDFVVLFGGTFWFAGLPWVTVPETVTRRFGGWLPVKDWGQHTTNKR